MKTNKIPIVRLIHHGLSAAMLLVATALVGGCSDSGGGKNNSKPVPDVSENCVFEQSKLDECTLGQHKTSFANYCVLDMGCEE